MRRRTHGHGLDSTTEQSVLPVHIAPVVERDVGGKRWNNPQKSKLLYSSAQEGVKIQIKCVFNQHTEHIGISTYFGNSTCGGSRKMLYMDISNMGVAIHVYCVAYPKTGYISIGSTICKKSGYKGGAVTNPSCTVYLGVIVAERILSKVFKNVKRMPYNNIGYDFKCSNDFGIDVKSACCTKNRPNSWAFRIKQNKVADYFLCLAFDNRKDLNPQHVWLIPANMLNHLETASVAPTTLGKWAEYELTDKLDDVLACCDTMKQRGGLNDQS